MFAALSIKTTLFTVLLISLASISIAQEDKPIKFTLSIQKSIHHPEADIEFERTDSNIKWFNDNSLSTNSDLIFGSTIPLNQINLNLFHINIKIQFHGNTLLCKYKYVCTLSPIHK